MTTLNRISDESVREATGRSWDEWLGVLDKAGAARWAHRDIASFLAEDHGIPPWWQQMVTVGYEQARGLRTVGQTAAVGYEIGVRRTLAVTPEQAWALLASPEGMKAWLGVAADMTEAAPYRTGDGREGEFRVVKPGSHVRLGYAVAPGPPQSTLQVRVLPAASGRATLSFHHEKLASADERERMRVHWGRVLDALERLAGRSDATAFG